MNFRLLCFSLLTQLAASWLLDGIVASCVLQLMQKELFPFRGRDGEKDKMTITGAATMGLQLIVSGRQMNPSATMKKI